jgi:vancomycin aglycone glucosyltransferase
VRHGGAGTTTTATRAGVPQVMVPQWADQPYWASRVADLGIGVAHDVQAPTTESLTAALRTVLTSETRARATAVAGTIRTDGATVAAKLLLEAGDHGFPSAQGLACGSSPQQHFVDVRGHVGRRCREVRRNK